MTNLRDKFLGRIGQEECTVFLVNGVKLNGRINGFDSYGLVLFRDGNSQFVERHAIATIMPQNSFGNLDTVNVKAKYEFKQL